MIEDNAADAFLVGEAMRAAGLAVNLDVLSDGEQAIRYFDALDADPAADCPEIVLLDINLPRMHGSEVLEHIRSGHRCAATPVIVVSTSDSTKDRTRMQELGANDYFRKPSDFLEFMKIGAIVRHMLDTTFPPASLS